MPGNGILCLKYDKVKYSQRHWKQWIKAQEIQQPLIVIENIKVTKDMITLMSRDKNPTLKIQLSNGISCIKFKSSEEEYKSLYSDQGYVAITLVGTPSINKWNSNITPQILINDYKIINRRQFYF